MTVHFHPDRRLRSFLQTEVIPDLRPQTADSSYLDRQTAEQLSDLTYRSGNSSDDTGEANCLAPTAVAEFEDEYFDTPAAHLASILVETDKLEGTDLDIEFSGFVQSVLDAEYDGSPYADAPDEVFVNTFTDGTEVELHGSRYPKPTSGPPLGFSVEQSISLGRDLEWQQEVTIDGTDSVVRRYDPMSRTTTAETTLERDGTPRSVISPGGADKITITYSRPTLELRLTVDVVPADRDGYSKIRVRAENTTSVAESDDPRVRTERRIYAPVLRFELSDIPVLFPTQQHDVKLQAALQPEADPDTSSDDEMAGLYDVYTQRDCFLTRVVDDFDTRWESRDEPRTGGAFLTTSFGVYDYIRQDNAGDGIMIAELLRKNDDELVAQMEALDGETAASLRSNEELLETLRTTLRALRQYIADDRLPPVDDEYDPVAEGENPLRPFQWAAIQERVGLLANGEMSPLVVQAPTGAGKTVVYFASTALSILYRDTRAVLPFPTRMLTEDKLKDVINLSYYFQKYTDGDIDCGICMGQQWLEDEGEKDWIRTKDMLGYIGSCHECGKTNLDTTCYDCSGGSCDDQHRHVAYCRDCGFEYDFMYDVKRTYQYLPRITVGTPEKFFRMPTVETHTDHSTYSSLPFFGAPYTECESCGRALTDMNSYRVLNGRDGLHCDICGQMQSVDWLFCNEERPEAKHSPIGHVVLDETHMYTGHFGIGMSIVINFFEVLASRLRNPESRTRDAHAISVDSGTATISNKLEHISQLLRTDVEDVVSVPSTGEQGEYFEARPDSVRYRVLGLSPVGVSNRGSFRQSIVETYNDFHTPGGGDFRDELTDLIDRSPVDADVDAYKLILGYLFKKSDGRALKNSIRDLADQISDGRLDPPFLSGDSPRSDLMDTVGIHNGRSESVVLANLVISLGIDIPSLNNLVLFGAPRSMSEQMQTIGRTGRNEAAGHAAVHLYPQKPRDMYLKREFHQVLGQVEDYFDRAAIQPTNPHVVDLLFDCVLGPFITIELAIRESSRGQPTEPDAVRIREKGAHHLAHLVEMIEAESPPLENGHVQAILRDLLSVFAPDDVEFDSRVTEEIELFIGNKMTDYFGDGTSASIWKPQAIDDGMDDLTNINEWFKSRFDPGDPNLRGTDQDRVSVETNWEIHEIGGQ